MADNPRAWLNQGKPTSSACKGHKAAANETRTTTIARACTSVERGRTYTMCKPGVYQNTLQATMHPHTRTGYKDPQDAANRSDKHNGGAFRSFDSTYRQEFAGVDEKTARFMPDGQPIGGAQRVPGKPLMAPKPPNPAEIGQHKRMFRKYHHHSNVQIGDPSRHDPRRFKSCYAVVHAAPARSLVQPNAGIAAEAAKVAHAALGLFS